MTVKMVGLIAENWIDEVFGSLVGCWADVMAALRAGYMTV